MTVLMVDVYVASTWFGVGYERNGMDPQENTTRCLRKRKAVGLPPFELKISEKRPKMTGAERSRNFRERLKKNPELYKAHRAYETARTKNIRAELKEDQRLAYNAKSRERMRKYRERQKAEGVVVRKVRRVMTRTEAEVLRRKWRDEKRRLRENMTSQKRRRVNELRRIRYKQKTQLKSVKVAQTTLTGEHDVIDEPCTSRTSAFPSEMAKRKAISRAKKTLPNSPKQFSSVVASIISSATPRKKTELHKEIICSPKARKRLDILESMNINLRNNLKNMGKTKKAIVQKRYMAYSLIKNAKKTCNPSREVVNGLGFSQKFINKVQNLDNNNLDSRKRRNDAMPTKTTETVENFYDRTDLVRTLPQNATKKGVKKILECSLLTMYEEFKKDHPHVKISYSKFVAMKPQNVMPMSKNKLMACLCEYCVNVELKIEAMNTLKKQKAARTGDQEEEVPFPSNKFDLSKLTTCDIETKACIDRTCQDCGTDKINNLLVNLTSEVDTTVTWFEWERTKYTNSSGKESLRMMKIRKEQNASDFREKIKTDLLPFPKHIFDAKWQSKQFATLSKEVPENTALFCCDFAENFACSYQDEAQGAHWSYDQVTIHPVVCYYRCPEESCNLVVEESFLVISDDHLHDSHAVHHYTKLAVEHLKTKGIRIDKLIQFSDGASSQYKGRTNFADLAYGPEDFCSFEKHFFGSQHGKGPCDREIGTVKRSVVLAVKARRAEITDARTFFEYCNSSLARPKNATEHAHFKRTSTFVTVGDIDRKRPERTSLKPVKATRKFHSFRSTENSQVTNIVESRERSCFCMACLGETTEDGCPNKHMIGEWISHDLKKRTRGNMTNQVGRARAGDGGMRAVGGVRVRGGGVRVRGGGARVRGGGARVRGGRGRGTRRGGRGYDGLITTEGLSSVTDEDLDERRSDVEDADVEVRRGRGQGRGGRGPRRGGRGRGRGGRGRGRGRGRLEDTDEEDTDEEYSASMSDGADHISMTDGEDPMSMTDEEELSPIIPSQAPCSQFLAEVLDSPSLDQSTSSLDLSFIIQNICQDDSINLSDTPIKWDDATFAMLDNGGSGAFLGFPVTKDPVETTTHAQCTTNPTSAVSVDMHTVGRPVYVMDEAPPVEDIGDPPVEDTGAPPVEDIGDPPVEDIGDPPVEDNGDPPVEDIGDPPVEDTRAPPVEDIGDPPVKDIGDPPVEDIGDPPVEDIGDPPVEDIRAPPVEDIGDPPVEDIGDPPVEDIGAPPVEDIGDPPVEDIGAPPVEDIRDPPVEDTGAPPVEDIGDPPVEDIGAPPVEDIGAPPVEDIGDPPVEDTGAPPVEDIGDPPVEDIEDPPVEDTGDPSDGGPSVGDSGFPVVNNHVKTTTHKKECTKNSPSADIQLQTLKRDTTGYNISSRSRGAGGRYSQRSSQRYVQTLWKNLTHQIWCRWDIDFCTSLKKLINLLWHIESLIL
ncbi:uncharacterized protein [Argopecten irradians]|uniref:uncharacterized protein n=1 Tax=Argopecten irradians TaxID=31199 RepID=UPI00371FF50B